MLVFSKSILPFGLPQFSLEPLALSVIDMILFPFGHSGNAIVQSSLPSPDLVMPETPHAGKFEY